MKGKLLIFSAPSGSGKTTIVKNLIRNIPNLKFSVSATSRPPREGETEGKDYYFLSGKEFRQKISNGEFLEYEEVYDGIYYGTLKSEVERILDQGKNIILDVDVEGGLNIKKIYGNEALAIFIKTPSLGELKKRLQNRSTESSEKIKMRIAKAKKELNYASRFDVVIINDELSKTLEEIKKIAYDFIRKNKI